MSDIEQMKEKGDVEGLGRLLSKKSDIMDQIHAVKALAEIGGSEAEAIVAAQLDSRHLPVRENAARALGALGSQDSVAALSKLAKQGGVDGEAAKRAIREIAEASPPEEQESQVTDPTATKACPMCGEEILAVAKKCKHCQTIFKEGHGIQETGQTSHSSSSNSGVIGTIMLLVPLVTTLLIWFWVGSMNLLQNPGNTMTVLGLLTVILTAILAAVEAQQVGAGKRDDVDDKGKKRSGPGAWFAVVLLLWVVGFPAWLYQRGKYGLTNLVAGGIIVGLIFAGSWYMMNSAIETKIAEVRNVFGSGARNYENDLGSLERQHRDLQEKMASPQQCIQSCIDKCNEAWTKSTEKPLLESCIENCPKKCSSEY